MTAPSPSTSAASASDTDLPRRGFLINAVTTVISFVIVTVPAVLGGLFFLDPILRKRTESAAGTTDGQVARKDDAGFIRLDVTRDAVPADGTPVAVTVRDDMADAWNMFRDVPVGSLWLRRVGDGPVLAFNSVCPHLGCSVNYRRAENDFFCPCHTSVFSLDGTKTNAIPPRDMDSLEVAMRTNGQDDPAGTEIWVRFQNFRRATPDKVAI